MAVKHKVKDDRTASLDKWPTIAAAQKIARPETRDARRTRQAILDSAEVFFARDGLHATRTEEIATHCGVTKAMIHYYFDTKEQLYKAVLERVFRERVEGMDFATIRRLKPGAALAEFVDRLLAQMCRKPHLGPLFALENIQNSGRYYSQSGGEIYRVLTDIVERGVNDRTFRDTDPRHAAINIMGACVHYFNITNNVRQLWPGARDGTAKLMQEHAESVRTFIVDSLSRRRPRQAS
jgi:TetR/AcrR family transcriptional regulator